MDIQDLLTNEGKVRIIQELVPGKQITIAHLIANPDNELYEKLGLNRILIIPNRQSELLRLVRQRRQ